MRKIQKKFEGTVEVEVDGVRYGAVAHLRSYVEMIDVTTFGGHFEGEGITSWRGQITDLSGTSIAAIVGKRASMIFPDGEARIIAITGMDGSVEGTREVPF